MPKYSVSIPITGAIMFDIEAESEADAIDKAFKSNELNIDNLEAMPSRMRRARN